MRHILILIIALAIILAPNFAQDDSPYQLHQPSAEEYLTLMPEIMEQIEIDVGEPYHEDISAIRKLMNYEMVDRYTYDNLIAVPYPILIEASPNIARNVSPEAFLYELSWHSLVLDAWLLQTGANLSKQDAWIFNGYELYIQQVDFTGDNVNEYMIEMHFLKGEYSSEYLEFFVLDQSYNRLGDTHMWFGYVCPYQLSCGGQGEILQVNDVTGDDLPDWVVSRGLCSYGRCAVRMEIYSYQEGQFVEVFTHDRPRIELVSGGGGVRSSPEDGVWEFDNVDDDAALEIIQTYTIIDNRGCEFTSYQFFDWNEELFLFDASETEITYLESAMCYLRQAHNAMKELDFTAAIEHYETMLAYPIEDGLYDVWQYAKVRLAIAYALDDNLFQAEEILNELEPIQIGDETISAMVSVAQASFAEHHDGIQLCSAINDLLSYGNLGFRLEHSILGEYGQNNDFSVPINYGGGDLSANNTGCNVWPLLPYEETTIETQSTNTPRPTATPNPDPLSCYYADLGIYGFCGNAENIEGSLTMINTILAQSLSNEQTVNFVYAFRYLRAYMLEKSGDTETALTGYIALHTDAPDSAWGKLAALHVELN